MPPCDVRRGRFSKQLVMAKHTHTCWYNMSPLRSQRSSTCNKSPYEPQRRQRLAQFSHCDYQCGLVMYRLRTVNIQCNLVSCTVNMCGAAVCVCVCWCVAWARCKPCAVAAGGCGTCPTSPTCTWWRGTCFAPGSPTTTCSAQTRRTPTWPSARVFAARWDSNPLLPYFIVQFNKNFTAPDFGSRGQVVLSNVQCTLCI